MRGRLDEYYIYPCALGPGQINRLKDQTCNEQPTACAKIKCQFYADCRVTGDSAVCVCPATCDGQPRARLCGNDGQTYENVCQMKRSSCLKKELVLKAYDGECEYNLFFGGNSYQTIKHGDLRYESKLIFRIRPENDNGVLFYTADTSSSSATDFLSLTLNDGYVNFKFDNGKGHAHLRSRKRIDLNQWNTIRAIRTGVEGRLIINGGEPVIGQTPGSLQQLNVDDVSFVGGMSTAWRSIDKQRVEASVGYQGCVKKLRLNGEDLNLRYPGPVVQSRSTVLGSCSASPCLAKPCLNGASCIATSAKSYQCICSLGYQGRNCENRVYVLPQQPASFNGKTSFLAYQQLLDSKHEHNIEMVFRTDRPNGMLLYAQGPAGVRDHLMVSLQNGRIVASFDLGAGNQTVTSALRYRQNRWLTLRIYRHNKRLEMYFNSRRVATGNSPGDSFISNLHTILYVGKADQLIEGKSHPRGIETPFTGCIQRITIDEHVLKFREPDPKLLASNDIASCSVCYQDVAIVFVIDSSSNVGTSGFLKTKEFLKTVIPYFNVGQTSIGVIDFTDTATISVPLSRDTTRDLSEMLDKVEFRGGKNARMSEGLELADIELRSIGFSSKYVILLTASDSGVSEKSTSMSVKTKLEQSGVKLIVLGVGDQVDESFLSNLASGDDQIYAPESFDHLIGSVQSIREDICQK